MSVAHDHGDDPDHARLHHLVDHLTPEQARRLLTLVRSHPELAESAVDAPPGSGPGGDADPWADSGRRLVEALGGIGASGHSDTAERHHELVLEWTDELR
ncbi:hypothetical protein [Streptomyces capparidis]